MTSDNLTVSYNSEYWVAIQPSTSSNINVFGPYSLAQANSNRTDWLRTYPESAIAIPTGDYIYLFAEWSNGTIRC